MNKDKLLKTLFVILFSLFFVQNVFSDEEKLEIYSPNYFSEQTKIYEDIHYLEDEYLSFKFCANEKSEDIKFNLICPAETIEITSNKYENTQKGCYYSNYNIQNLSCDDFSLEISYTLENKEKHLKRTFKKQKQSMLINNILGEDYTLLNPVDLSYYLIVLADLETTTSKNSEEIYELLKNIRDNDNKCWTSSSCKLLDTTIILRNLIMAGYNLNSRLLEDGKNYLERKTLSNQKNPISFYIEIDDDFENITEIECELQIDNESAKTYSFDNETLNLTKKSSDSILFTCNETIDEITLDIYNLQGKLSETKTYEDEAGFTYDIEEFACLGESNTCDFSNNLNSLITYSSSIEDASKIETYINTYKSSSNGQTYIDTTNTVYENTGKYLYYKSDASLLEYLKFKQNNDGSWGTNSRYDKIIETSWAVLGIQKIESSSEYVTDGKKWVYYNEPIAGWGSIEKNTLAYLAIREQIKPYLKINIENQIKDTTIFVIENPTIYKLKDIKIKFSEDINKYLSYNQNLGEMQGQDQLIFNVTVTNNFFGKTTGEITITGIDGKSKELILIKMPITIVGQTPFSIKEEPYFISEDSNDIELEIINNIETFTGNCSYLNIFNNQNIQVNISHLTKQIVIKNPDLKTGIYDFNFKCNIENANFEFKVPLNINSSIKSLEINETIVNITNTDDFKISLTNTLDEKQIITFEIIGDYIGLIEPTETEKIIASKDTREIYFTITNPTLLEALGNNSNGEILIKSENGYIKKIPLSINMTKPEEESKGGWLLITISILVIFGIVIVILRYLRTKQNGGDNHKDSNEDEMYI